VPTRTVTALHTNMIGESAAVVMAETRDGAAAGLQTQVWQRISGQWLIAAAHVTAPPATFDRSVWRVVGDPLLPPTGAGPLDGLGVAVKDLFAVAGQPIGAGVPQWLAEQRPQNETAPAVTALRNAGAHVVGIARTDEFAYSLAGTNVHYGSPPNPAVPGGISGGSTSGPTSAVALGQADVGLGTDTGGSIRVPASYQGLVGLRTTHGAIDSAGVLPLAPSFDTVGWITRDVATSARVAKALLPESNLRPRRILRLPTIETLANREVREAFPAVLQRLGQAEIVELPAELLQIWFAAFRTVQGFEAWQAHGDWIAAHPGALGPDVAGRFAAAASISESAAAAAREVVHEARSEICSWLADSVLAIPAACGPAPSRNAGAEEIEADRAATLRMTCLAGLSGAPALTLPLLPGPVGVCLVASPGTDRGLLEFAGCLS
jgi:Asp-tRNA(Asn)/Glu-tRNA(Gln) amidotransferase A subunit family amidase